MSISDKARLISSILSSLTPSELHTLKEEIDSIISIKDVENLKDDINEQTYNASIEFLNSINDRKSLTLEELTSLKNKTTVSQPLWKSESTVVSSPLVTYKIVEAEKVASNKKPSRPLGIWKGKVEISEDFYKTSSDILSEFGIEE